MEMEIKIIAVKQYTMGGEGVVHRRPGEVEMTKYHGRFERERLLLSNNVPWEVMKILTGIVKGITLKACRDKRGHGRWRWLRHGVKTIKDTYYEGGHRRWI